MPDFDTSNVAATVGQGQQNPLAGLGQIAQTVGALNQLKLFPLQQQTLQTELQTRQQSLAAAKYGALQTVLAQTGGDDEVPGALNRAVAMGLIDPQTAASAMGGNIPNLSLDAIHRMREQAISGAGNAAELLADRGQSSTQNVGGSINTYNTKVAPGGATTVTPATGAAAVIPTTLSPSEEASPVSVVGQGGITTRQPLSTFVTPTGQPQPGVAPPVIANPEAMSRAAAVGAASTATFGYTGEDGAQHEITGGALLDPATGAFRPNVKDAAGNEITDAKGALQVTLPPSAVAQLNASATNQADRAASLQTAFEGSAQRKALAEEMLEANGEFRSGPGAAKWGQIVTEANRIFGTKFAADPTTAQQVAGKIAQMLAAQQRDTLGLPATNAGQAAADIASPNTAYSAGAIQALAGQLAGNEDLLQKKEAAWTKYSTLPNGKPRPGATYNGFVGQFNKAFDPRYFWDRYVPAAQQAPSGMSAADAAAYNAAKQRALGATF